jgi:fermentation-respiration switch protein FrsA (DUF1100 family)
VQFFSEGARIDGELYVPDDLEPGTRRPAILCCQGYTGVRGITMPDYAQRFMEHGFVALIFDYRGFGTSGGERWRQIPLEQVDDVRNAVTYLATRDEVDEDRIGVWGASFGGANAVYAAGIDERIKAVVGQVGFGDGKQFLFDHRTPEQREQLVATIERNRRRRVLGEAEEKATIQDVLATQQIADTFEVIHKVHPEVYCELSWESAEKTLEYRPIDVVAQISPRPLLIVGAELDDICRMDRLQELYDRAQEPKEIVGIPVTHFDIYVDDAFEQSAGACARFFGQHLGLEVGDTAIADAVDARR